MIILTPEEIMALAEARGHPPGICTVNGVLDEARWTAAGNGPLPAPAEIAAATAAYRSKPKAKTADELILGLQAKVTALEAKVK